LGCKQPLSRLVLAGLRPPLACQRCSLLRAGEVRLPHASRGSSVHGPRGLRQATGDERLPAPAGFATLSAPGIFVARTVVSAAPASVRSHTRCSGAPSAMAELLTQDPSGMAVSTR